MARWFGRIVWRNAISVCSALTLSFLPFLLCFLLLPSSSSPLLSLHHSSLLTFALLCLNSVLSRPFLFPFPLLFFPFHVTFPRLFSFPPFPFFFFSSSCFTFLTSLPSFPILLLFPLSFFFLSISSQFFPLCFLPLPFLFFLDSSSSLPPVPLRLMVPSCFY